MKTTLAAASKPDEPALVTTLFARRLAQPIAVVAVKCGIPANAVTVAGGLCWVLSLPIPALILRSGCDTYSICTIWLIAAFLWCAGYILDVADGSVARMSGSSSRSGFFLDYVFHLLFKPAFLFSFGLGLSATLRQFDFAEAGCISWPFLLLAVLSIPANGAAETCAAERTLCDEVATGHLKMDGMAAPGLWLGSDDVTAPASRKRGSFLRTAKTLAAEVASYYLQGPFFAALVVADCVLAATTKIVYFPLTSAVFLLLTALLVVRIPLRIRRESRRLGRATKCGRAGRAVSLLAAAARACLVFVPAASTLWGAPRVRLALAAGWFAAAAFETLASRLCRMAGSPVHNRFLGLAAETAWIPAGAGSAIAFLCLNQLDFLPISLAPLAAVAFAPAECGAAAHVFCQDIGKGKLREDSPVEERRALAARRAHEPGFAALAPKWLFPVALACDFAFPCTLRGAAAMAVAAAAVLSLPVRVRRTMRAISGEAR